MGYAGIVACLALLVIAVVAFMFGFGGLSLGWAKWLFAAVLIVILAVGKTSSRTL